MKISMSLITAAVRLAADAPLEFGNHGKPPGYHHRTQVKRSLIVELRRELDKAGFGDDWRTLNEVIRIEERGPQINFQEATS